MIERVWRCTWRPWSCELEGCDQARLEMQLEAMIKRVWRCTWRPWLCKLGAHNCVSLEIHLEAVIERICRCTWRPWSCELGGPNCASLEIHLEDVMERVWRCTWRSSSGEIGRVLGGSQSPGGSLGGRHNGSWDSIHCLTRNCGNVENWVQHGLPRDWLGAGDSQSWDDAVHGVCCTRC